MNGNDVFPTLVGTWVVGRCQFRNKIEVQEMFYPEQQDLGGDTSAVLVKRIEDQVL